MAAAGAGGRHRFDLVGFSLAAAVATFIAAELFGDGSFAGSCIRFSYGVDPRMRLPFDLWLHLALTDKIALGKLLLVSGLSREFLSAFDENTIGGIIQSFVAMSDWPLIEQNIRVSHRGYAGAGQEDQATDIINHRDIRPDGALLLYSGVG